jgi:hypothetical protein
MLSSLLNDPEISPDDFPLAKPEGEGEPPTLQHLRNGSNYLSPGGLLDTLRLPAVVITGLLLNALLLLPFIMAAVIVTEFLHEYGGDLGSTDGLLAWLGFLRESDLSLLIAVPALALLYMALVGVGRETWARNNRRELRITLALAALLLAVVAIPLLHVVQAAIQLPLLGPDGLWQWVLSHVFLALWIVAAGLGLGAVVILKASDDLNRVASRIAIYAAAVVGPAFLFGVYLMLVVLQVDSPFVPYAPEFGAPFRAQEAAHFERKKLSAEVHRELLGKGIDYTRQDDVPAVYAARTGWHLAKPGRDRFRDPEALVRLADDDVEDSEAFRFRLDADGDHVEIIGAKLRLGGKPGATAILPDVVFAALMLTLFVLNFLFLDVNRTSMHAFYRDRLSRLYLFRRRRDGEVEANDRQKLSDLNRPGTAAPYHLLNAALNLQGSVVATQRGRSSGFFFFSKHVCGGPETGYCATPALETWDPHLDLGTAMAISAAAAAPNMGAMTKRGLVFVLTLLNIRLGYWLPNPRRVNTRRPRRIGRLRPRSWYLFREALGALDAESRLVNVSDGGHIENLGMYELLRRRCALIVAVDGEADPNRTFGGLTTLMRFAKIDLGVDIDLDLEELRPDEEGLSRACWALGTIRYGRENGARQTGTLLYVKSSVTGEEALSVQKYRAENPTFPHQTTADQYFDEAQFEAYRALGEQMGRAVVDDERTTGLPGFARD